MIELFAAPAMDADACYARGRDLEAVCSARAAAAYRDAVHADPDHAGAHANLGRLLHEGGLQAAGQVQAAEHHYRAAARACPDEPIYWYNLGVILEDTGRDAQAAISYQAAVALDPSFADAHFNLAGVFERLGDVRGAVRHLAVYRRLFRRLAG